jgi:hypothetical protein
MNRKEMSELVARAWVKLPNLHGALGSFSDDQERILKLAIEEERQHRRGAPDGYRHVASVSDAARLLVLHDIAGAIVKTPAPLSFCDFFARRQSWIAAAAIAERHGAEIRAAWESADISVESIAALDYADFCNSDKE